MDLGSKSFNDFESTLKKHAQELVARLEEGNFSQAVLLINELNQVRDRGLYQEIGKLTRELHNAIVNFQIDPQASVANEVTGIADATDRLSYVVQMTERAANRTMDLVEASTPLIESFGHDAHELHAEWSRFMRRELSAEEFRELAKRVGAFLGRSDEDAHKLSSLLNDILLAQDYQDLTGQVIKRVTSLVTQVESDLVKLVRMAGQVDRYAGISHDHEKLIEEIQKEKSSKGEGPQIHADKREDVVSNQDDVDDLLSSLGF
jgi:chemotaxis protein CheZ